MTRGGKKHSEKWDKQKPVITMAQTSNISIITKIINELNLEVKQ